MRPFVVFALPRSRTAWLAKYLSYSGESVGHDVAVRSDSIESFFSHFDEGMIGTVETGAMAGWRLLRERVPAAAIAVVRRPIEDVKLSLSQFGVFPRAGDLEGRAAVLDEIDETERRPLPAHQVAAARVMIERHTVVVTVDREPIGHSHDGFTSVQ